MDITWDRWAVPTIVGDDELDVTNGFGRAQAQSNATLVLELYGTARGQAAALWGPQFVDEDTFVARLGLKAMTDEWLAAQTPATLARIAAFCDGFNAACAEDPALGTDRREVLPVGPRDVLAHVVRTFVRFTTMDSNGLAFSPTAFLESAGSNGWAVSAGLSTTGHAQLMINPHLGWKGFHRWFEARSTCPGRDFHGATLLGLPWQALGYGRHVGWGHTVNPVPNMTVYDLGLTGDTYLFDGEQRTLETVEHHIGVAGGEPVTVLERRSVHGPVVTAPDGVDVAVRLAGVLHHPATSALEGWWRMSLATGVEDLFATHDAAPLPLFNVLAADASGSIGALYCGTPPVAAWDGVADVRKRLPGDDPRLLWDEVHPACAMPRVIDPDCGWVQNVNDNPWLFTDPPLDQSRYPAAIAPDVDWIIDLRTAASRGWLMRQKKISPKALLGLKYSKRAVLADCVLDDLCAAAADDAGLAPAIEALTAWDRHAHRDSFGYVLFLSWGLLSGQGIAAGTLLKPSAEPGGMPGGLLDPEGSVEVLRAAVGLLTGLGVPLDASVGQVCRLGSGEDAVAADGGSGILGVLKVLELLPMAEGLELVLGDSWISHVQFRGGDWPQARSLLVYGNTSEPSAPCAESQYPLWAADRLRPEYSVASA
ncbi:penicillin acylase family protein [Streptomyces flavofungini]|uniref:penicillin acylase family protein n=1 Tax=Streptomyces flavofungini TaxID=68200 RepID=UPI0034DF18CB